MTLKETLLLNNWSYEDVSIMSGIDVETLIKYENRIEEPSIDNISTLLNNNKNYTRIEKK